MLDLLALEKSQAAIDFVRDSRPEQRVLQHPRLGVGTVQERHAAQVRTGAVQRFDFINDEAGFVVVRRGRVNAHRLALACLSPQILAEPLLVLLDHCVGGIENIALRTIILLQLDDIAAGIVSLEIAHVADLGTAEFVDRLIVVAHREHRRAAAAEQSNPAVLQLVGVLEFIDQNEFEALAIMFQQRRMPGKQFKTAQQ